MKPFLFFLLLTTTVILPANVFGFNQVEDKISSVNEIKKDQIGFEIYTFVNIEESYNDSDEFYSLIEYDDLNLRWEPHNSFIGDVI